MFQSFTGLAMKNRLFIIRIRQILLALLVYGTVSAIPLHAGPLQQGGDPDDNIEMQREHEALMKLVQHQHATHTSTQSGNWSDPATWGGQLPGDGARVVVATGHTITVDGVFDTPLMTIRVDGVLRFVSNVNTQLRVDTLITDKGSVFTMGTEQEPIQSGVIAKLIINDYNESVHFETQNKNSPDYDPFKLGQGLIAHGRFKMYGAVKTSYATMNGAQAGDSTLTLDNLPSDWNVGDELVIAGTQVDGKGDEARKITALNAGANSVTLDAPLALTHDTPRHNKQGLTLKVHVANMTRNAVVETTESGRAASGTVTSGGKTGDAFDKRGHVMFMHHNDVSVNYGGFYHLGRSNKLIPIDDTQSDDNGNPTRIGVNPRARYPVHFHRAGTDGVPGSVLGAAVVDSPGWGYVNHSSNVDMTSNVAYDVDGAAFATEMGDEHGSFVMNLAIKSHGVGKSGIKPWKNRRNVKDFGFHGHSFWLTGSSGVEVRNNIANGSSNFAYGTHFPVLKLFEENEAYGGAGGVIGFWGGKQVMRGTLGWRMGFSSDKELISFRYSDRVNQYDTTLIGDLDNPTGVGIGTHEKLKWSVVENAHLEGFNIGLDVARWGYGFASHRVTHGYFNNINGMRFLHGFAQRATKTQISGNIRFGQLSTAALAGRTQAKMQLAVGLDNKNTGTRYYGEFGIYWDIDSENNPQRLYLATEQAPDYIPLVANESNQTNAQRVAAGQKPVGGKIWPNNAVARSDMNNVRAESLENPEPNIAPVATADSATTNQDSIVNINVLTNDSDADGDTLSVTSASSGANGSTVVNSDGTITYTPNAGYSGTDSFTYTISDGRGGEAAATVNVTVNQVLPQNTPPVAQDDTADVAADQSVRVNVLTNDSDADGDSLTISSVTQGVYGLVEIDNGAAIIYTPNVDSSTDSFSYTISDGKGGEATATVTVTVTEAEAEISLETGTVSNVGSDSWTTVTLNKSYNSMVVVASANYDKNSGPGVVRIRNASGNSFEVQVQSTSSSAISGLTVHYVVVEEGVYTVAEHGVAMEAVKFTSTVTDRRSSWQGASRSYANSYRTPIVVGQVMSVNDANFSAFWTRGGSRTQVPSASAFYVGKHVGEDPNWSRSDETIGYIVVEAGSYQTGGLSFVAGRGADSVAGVHNTPPYNYSLTGLSSATAAIVSQTGMDGGNGGWAILYGQDALSATTLKLAIDEDQLKDSERYHTTEQDDYLVFGTPAVNTRMGPGMGGPADYPDTPVDTEALGNQVFLPVVIR